MSRKVLVAAAVAALSLCFVVVSLLVLLSRGRGPLLGAKLRLGALLLSLGAVAVTGSCGDDEVTCYAPAISNHVVVEDPEQEVDGVPIDLSLGNVIRCRIESRSGDAFSWRIADDSLVEIDRGDIEPLDGAWDESTEQFEIVIDPSLSTGAYWLWLYETDATHQPTDPYGFSSIRLLVTNDGG